MLHRNGIDALAVRKTKRKDDQFPTATFEELGYQVTHHGLNQWNGVVIISHAGLEDTQAGFPGQPGLNKDPDATPSLGARHITVTCGGTCVHSLYIPSGRDVTGPHLEYKLEFLEQLRQHIIATLDDGSEATFMMGGDSNIVPTDGDAWSMATFTGKTHVIPPECAAFYTLEQAGTKEVTCQFTPNQWTYWDHRVGRLLKDEGMRIDFQLTSPALVTKAPAGFIDIEECQGKGVSDHTPVIVDYEVWINAAEKCVSITPTGGVAGAVVKWSFCCQPLKSEAEIGDKTSAQGSRA